MLELNKNDARKILDDFEQKSKRKKVKRRRVKIASKVFLNKYVLTTLVLFIVGFISLSILNALTAPPYYSDKETEESYQRLLLAINNTGKYREVFLEPIEYLEQYPYFYKKVVNNVQNIKFVGKIKVSSGAYIDSFAINPYSKTLMVYDQYINKGGRLDASTLIHEADHSEFWRAKGLRKYYLNIRCSPITNSKIVNGNIPDTYHRVKVHEICAEREQVRFGELEGVDTGYLAEHGMFASFMIAMWELVEVMFSVIISIFR